MPPTRPDVRSMVRRVHCDSVPIRNSYTAAERCLPVDRICGQRATMVRVPDLWIRIYSRSFSVCGFIGRLTSATPGRINCFIVEVIRCGFFHDICWVVLEYSVASVAYHFATNVHPATVAERTPQNAASVPYHWSGFACYPLCNHSDSSDSIGLAHPGSSRHRIPASSGYGCRWSYSPVNISDGMPVGNA